jgi:glycosyltransferase involved in cell wall biosynthesis
MSKNGKTKGWTPLVSILVYNFNYGRFLKECLESAINQTYPNVEIVFSDNASTDESWEVALEILDRYPDRITVIRNRSNVGGEDNLQNCIRHARGDYYVILCSDDVLMPDYVERCLEVFRANYEVAFVIVNRNIWDAKGAFHTEAPFYRQSCVVPGKEQAAVYMMAAVNPSISQIMYNRHIANDFPVVRSLGSQWYTHRLQDFLICMEHDIAYLVEPLVYHRLHGENDSIFVTGSLLEIFSPYVMKHQFSEYARFRNETKVAERLQPALANLSRLALRYCLNALLANDSQLAKRYFYLAPAIDLQVEEEPLFKELREFWHKDEEARAEFLHKFKKQSVLLRRVESYDPPPGSMIL